MLFNTRLGIKGNEYTGDPAAKAAFDKTGALAGLTPFLKFISTAGIGTALTGVGTKPPIENNFMPNNNPLSEIIPGQNNSFDLQSILGKILDTLGIKNPGTPVGSNGSNGTDYLKYLIPILAGVSGGLEGRPQSQTTTPNIPSNMVPLQNNLIDKYMSSINNATDLSGYKASGIDDINRTADSQRRNAEETLASRGIFGPATGTALNNVDNNRVSSINKFTQSIPLLQNTLQQQALSSAGGFFNSAPRGQTVQSSGNILGGATGGATELLAYLYGLGKI